jgi:hypothetical protein
MDKLNLVLSVEEINAILEALGDQPFVKVNGIINTIRVQAIEQMQPQQEAALEQAAAAVGGSD